MIIIVTDLVKRFGDNVAVDGVSVLKDPAAVKRAIGVSRLKLE